MSEPVATVGREARNRRSLVGGRPGEANRPVSAASLIHANVRDDIVSMRRKPGDAIVEKEIAEAYGVSRTPIREALLRLANEGLVDIFPQSGTFVAHIPVRALPEAIVIRTSLEETAARLAAERATRSQIIGIHAIVEKLRESEASNDRDAFHQSDERFHAAIADMAGYPGIWTIVQQVKLQVDRYRRLTLPQEGRMLRVIEEHAAIVKAIEARDSARAAALMNAHLSQLITDIEGIKDLNPDYFIDAASQARGS